MTRPALLVCLLLAACGPPAAPPRGVPAPMPPRSPAELHARIQHAVRAGRPGELVLLHAPVDRPLYLFKLAVVANLAAQAGGGEETLRSLFARHNVPDGGTVPEGGAARRAWAARWLASVDLVALGEALAAFCGEQFTRGYRGELRRLVVEGDRARARIGATRHRFKRAGGAWFIDPEGD